MKLLLSTLLFIVFVANANGRISAYKFASEEMADGGPDYVVPHEAKNFVSRQQDNAPDILFYLSKPEEKSYPIVFFCTGSSQKNRVCSVIHAHRYFLQECMDLDCGLITLEQRGVSDQEINRDEFWNNYTRTERLRDHELVIGSLFEDPPAGWNGKLIFIGCSEGGPIVNSLTEKHGEITVATISFSGAGDWSWRDELWIYINQGVAAGGAKLTRKVYDIMLDQVLEEPTFEKELFGMTNAYLADALCWSEVEYAKLIRPYLVVSGALDSFIVSSDDFVKKAKQNDVEVTYFRVEDMDHYIIKRPDIIKKSFGWLQNILKKK